MLVRLEDDATAKLMEAVGTLSKDGKSSSVVVTREDGPSSPTTCATEIS